MGGGTGTYAVLYGLKHYPVDITAIVSMSDSGGSTGRLRSEFGILPPGDLRNCLVALSNNSKMARIFQHRFNGTNSQIKEVGEHNLGNIILTALEHINGDFMVGLKSAHEILGVDSRNRVLPITLANIQLKAIYSDGTEVIGETKIDRPDVERVLPIKDVFIIPESYICKESEDAIVNSDLIVLGPGDLYTSIIPTLLPIGVREALQKTNAKKVYVCNVMTKKAETYGYKASDFAREVERYAGVKMDFVVCNCKKPSYEALQKYHEEGAHFVEPDLNGRSIILGDFISDHSLVRHDPEKLAKCLMDITLPITHRVSQA